VNRWDAFTYDELIELYNGIVSSMDTRKNEVYLDVCTRLYREINDEIERRGPDAAYEVES